jgi:hypothetical protein
LSQVNLFFYDAHVKSVIFGTPSRFHRDARDTPGTQLIVFFFCAPCETFASRNAGWR